jgi:hypothetical protein
MVLFQPFAFALFPGFILFLEVVAHQSAHKLAHQDKNGGNAITIWVSIQQASELLRERQPVPQGKQLLFRWLFDSARPRF